MGIPTSRSAAIFAGTSHHIYRSSAQAVDTQHPGNATTEEPEKLGKNGKPPHKKSHKGFIISIIVIVVLALIGLSIWLVPVYLKYKRHKEAIASCQQVVQSIRSSSLLNLPPQVRQAAKLTPQQVTNQTALVTYKTGIMQKLDDDIQAINAGCPVAESTNDLISATQKFTVLQGNLEADIQDATVQAQVLLTNAASLSTLEASQSTPKIAKPGPLDSGMMTDFSPGILDEAMRTYNNSKYGYSVQIPENFAKTIPLGDGNGMEFRGPGQTMRVSVGGYANTSNQTPQGLAKEYMQGSTPLNLNISGPAVTLQMDSSGIITYVKAFVYGGNNSRKYILTIQYQKSNTQLGDKVAEKIANSFKPGPGNT